MDPQSPEGLEIETALLKRIAAGDRRSFEEFYDRLSGILLAAAFRILNNAESAEDVLQEVFIQIWEKAPLYDPKRGKPLAWAMTLTRHKAIDRLRSLQRQTRLREAAQAESQVFDGFAEQSGFDAVESGDVAKIVRAALQTLPASQREALELAFFHSLTQAEIAEKLNTPLGTVKARIRRGMVALRDAVSPYL